MHIVCVHEPKETGVSFSEMKIGQIGVILTDAYSIAYGVAGKIVLRAYSSWVVLNNPNTDWLAKSRDPVFKVRLIKPETVISLTVGNDA